jgi:hypothetical protein
VRVATPNAGAAASAAPVPEIAHRAHPNPIAARSANVAIAARLIATGELIAGSPGTSASGRGSATVVASPEDQRTNRASSNDTSARAKSATTNTSNGRSRGISASDVIDASVNSSLSRIVGSPSRRLPGSPT